MSLPSIVSPHATSPLARSTHAVIVASLFSLAFCAPERSSQAAPPTNLPAGLETAIFAGGCFWCMEGSFEKVPGVAAVISGFTGGPEKDPITRWIPVARAIWAIRHT